MMAEHHNFLTHDQLECQHFSNIAMSTYPNMLEPVLGPNVESILSELEDNFPPVNPHPKETMGSIMYKAGQRSVIEWIHKRIEDN